MTQIMYIGPHIPGVVRRNQIFTYRPEKVIGEAAKVSVLAKHLFVRMDEIVEKKSEIDRCGSVLHTAYQTVSKIVREGTEK